MAKYRGFQVKVDNHMHGFGETDFNKKVVRINKKRSKKTAVGELIDTVVHEITHIRHPQMHEKNVRKKTKKNVKKMSRRLKSRLYSLVRKSIIKKND